MFERFTRQVRKTTVLAQEGARRFGHGYIGAEHFLLVKENEGVASRIRQVLPFEVGVRFGSLGGTVVPRDSDPGRSPGMRLSRAFKR